MKHDYLISKLKSLVVSERRITAEIVELIKEIDQKRIYLDYGHTSMFAMLIKDFGYTPSAAMRRIDAARLSKEIPEIKESLKSGEINLSQVSMLAQAVRQKEKEDLKQVSKETKAVLLEQVKSMDLIATQKTLASSLDIEVQTYEKKTYQKDETLKLEVVLPKDLQKDLERVKELISHQNPSPTMAELIQFLVNHFLDKRDPLRQTDRVKMACKERAYAAAVARARHAESKLKIKSIRTIPVKIKQQIFKRDQACQWATKINRNGKIVSKECGSRFQLQIDHIKPKWQDGCNDSDNLQVLCSVHNKLKYQHEIIGKIS